MEPGEFRQAEGAGIPDLECLEIYMSFVQTSRLI